MFNTKNRILHEIMVSLGGRIAEEIVFDDVTTGASQDIKEVTNLARSMVTRYGMSEKLGMINYESDDEVLVSRDFAHTKAYSEDTATAIDNEVRAIVDDCYKKAKDIILSRRDILDKCAALLLEKETGIGRNTWSRRMKEFITHLNSPIYIPKLDESGIITIPSVEELFLKYGANTTELKNEIAKLLNIISDLYTDAKKLATLEETVPKMQLEIKQLKEQLSKVTVQKTHYEILYNQIIAESYFPHLYGQSKKLKQAKVKAEVITLPNQNSQVLELNSPNKVFQNESVNLNTVDVNDKKIEKLNELFNLDLEDE